MPVDTSHIHSAELDQRTGLLDTVLRTFGEFPDSDRVVDRLRSLGTEAQRAHEACMNKSNDPTCSTEERDFAIVTGKKIDSVIDGLANLIVEIGETSQLAILHQPV